MKNKIYIDIIALLIIGVAVYFLVKKNDVFSSDKEVAVKQILPDSAQAWWYKKAVIYNVDVEKYKDADGDGIGDFKGITEKLSYIDSLGFNTIWLAPFQPLTCPIKWKSFAGEEVRVR
jgi:maltose alpha-D-glucosyltransferase/alpha-amylase